MMAHTQHRSRGFSMLEVLVTLLIVSFGLLGLSKMQAAALSNTQIARTRSLIALQASSLAAAMHGNRGFWAIAGDAPTDVSATGSTITDAAGIFGTTANCGPAASAACTPAQLAAYDFQTWVSNMNNRFPSYTAAVQCTAAAPVSCVINLTWNEKYVAINRGTAAAAGGTQAATQQFSLYVEP